MDPNVDEDLIEATIRRVAEAQAARAASDEQPAPERMANSIAEEASAGARQLSATAEAPLAGQDMPEDDAEPAPVALRSVDESAIEETIRRVAAARASRDSDEDEGEPEAPAAPAIEPPLAFVPRGTPATAVAVRQQAGGDDDEWTRSIERIEGTLAEVHGMLRELLDRPVAGATASRFTPPPAKQTKDDWEDDAPVVPKMAFTPAPRPSVLRDVTPAPAIEHAVNDERPLPEPLPPVRADERRGLDLLPRTYRITVEDKRRGVDLVPLHRALLAMDGVRDMSLLSYNNGVAIVALETVNDIDPQLLGRAVGRAMSRPAAVETHNERTLVVKLAEE